MNTHSASGVAGAVHGINVRAIEFETPEQAVRHIHITGEGEAILVGSDMFVVEHCEAQRLASAGVEFEFLDVPRSG